MIFEKKSIKVSKRRKWFNFKKETILIDSRLWNVD